MRNQLMGAVARYFPTQFMGERRWLAALWRTFFYAIGPTEAFRFRTRDYEMFAVPNRWHLSRSVLHSGQWERFNTELFRSYLKPGMLVVDVGANFGHYALTAANRIGPEGLVLAFEPLPSVYDDLCRNATLTTFNNIRTFAMALGDVDGTAEMVVDSSSSGWSSLVAEVVPSPGERITVQVRRLLSILEDTCPGRNVGLIKIDTEGFEAQVFNGAWDIIARDRPLVITEFSLNRIRHAGEDPEALLQRLMGLGYRPSIIDERNECLIHADFPVENWATRFETGLNIDAAGDWFTYLLLEPRER